MKSLKLLLAVCAISTTGCAYSLRSPVTGFLYTGASAGEIATTNTENAKVGESCAMSILGLIGTGDATIEAAAKDGGISKIAYVDSESFGVLGIYAEYCTIVHGN